MSYKQRKLSRRRFLKLDAAGFVWDPFEASWYEVLLITPPPPQPQPPPNPNPPPTPQFRNPTRIPMLSNRPDPICPYTSPGVFSRDHESDSHFPYVYIRAFFFRVICSCLYHMPDSHFSYFITGCTFSDAPFGAIFRRHVSSLGAVPVRDVTFFFFLVARRCTASRRYLLTIRCGGSSRRAM